MKKMLAVLAIGISLSSCLANGYDQSYETPKNVIFIVPDGMGFSAATLGRWMNGNQPNAVDTILIGAQQTWMANSVVTGSAAAATAFSSGFKTSARFLGVGPREEDLLSTYEMPYPADKWSYRPLATILEAARLQGKSTGLVATSRITHATPAAYAAKIHDRGLDNEIMEHLVYAKLDLVFGGGFRHLIPSGEEYTTSFGATWKGKRTDGENLYNVLLDRGYQIVDDRAGMENISSGKVWGLFDDSHMDPQLDRAVFNPQQPAFEEMAAKALAILSQNSEGFFLMIEESQLDWGAHANDPAYVSSEFKAFDNVVKMALDFARNDGETLVIAFPDHSTGGVSIHHNRFNLEQAPYTNTSVEALVTPIQNMKVTAEGIVKLLGSDYSEENLKSVVKEQWKIDLTAEDIEEIRSYKGSSGLSNALANVVSHNHTGIGFTTHGHDGGDCPVYAWGPGRPLDGTMDNTDMVNHLFKLWGVNAVQLNKKLYVNAMDLFPNAAIDLTDPANPVLQIDEWSLPTSKDLLINNRTGKVKELKGLVVYAPVTNRVYIPRQAVRMIDPGKMDDVRKSQAWLKYKN